MKNDPPGNVVDLEQERSRRARGRHAAPPQEERPPSPKRERAARKPTEPEQTSRGSSRRAKAAQKQAEQAQVETLQPERAARSGRRGQPPENRDRARRGFVAEEEDTAPRSSHTLLKVGMFAMLLLIVALLGGTILLGDTFRIHNILIEGTTYVSNEELIQLSGVREGENIFFLDSSLIKQRIESNPMLMVSSVIRKYPDTVLLEIIERKPTAVVEYMGSYGVLDEQGKVLRMESTLPAGSYPLLTGLRLTNVEVGKTVEIDNKKQTEAMNQLLQAFSSVDALSEIAQINLVDTNTIEMTSRTGISIQLGDAADLSSKASLVQQMLPGLQQKGYTGGRLLVDANGASYIPDSNAVPASTNPPAASPTADPSATTPPEGARESTGGESLI